MATRELIQLQDTHLLADTAEIKYNKIEIVLIQPTKYNDQGYTERGLWNVMPSNSLNVMYSLTEHALASPIFDVVDKKLYGFSECIRAQYQTCENIRKRYLNTSPANTGTLLIVMLVGVQTNQYPRAYDLAVRWREVGAKVIIGGFHVSSILNDKLYGKDLHQDIKDLHNSEIIVFEGEADNSVLLILQDCLYDREELHYKDITPDISASPLPRFPADYTGQISSTVTLDTSRGCVFNCSFCSIINVQGRKMRHRPVQDIIAWVENQAKEHGGKLSAFFTDDNIGRHPQFRKLCDGLEGVQNKGFKLYLFAETDIASYKNRGKKDGEHELQFFERAQRAGIYRFFTGIESLTQGDLKGVSKNQNNVTDYIQFVKEAHAHNIQIHAGFIIGFPSDTPESIKRAAQELHNIGFAQVSFFILTPIPGSRDHAQMLKNGVPMSPDWNEYDSFHPVWYGEHTMSKEQWIHTYKSAWRIFYSRENITERLKQYKDSPKIQTDQIWQDLWYYWSIHAECKHPMLGIILRTRNRSDMRPGHHAPAWPVFYAEEVARCLRYGMEFIKTLFTFSRIALDCGLVETLSRDLAQLAEDTAGSEYARLKQECTTLGAWAKHTTKMWLPKTFGKISQEWLTAFWECYKERKRFKQNAMANLLWHTLALSHLCARAIYIARAMLTLPYLWRQL
jgi:radical SAM superfamily enzyme YgiQ (UPF0313 family)